MAATSCMTYPLMLGPTLLSVHLHVLQGSCLHVLNVVTVKQFWAMPELMTHQMTHAVCLILCRKRVSSSNNFDLHCKWQHCHELCLGGKLRVTIEASPLSSYLHATCKLWDCCKVETWVTSGHHLITLRCASDLSVTYYSNASKADEFTIGRLVVQIIVDSG